MNNPKNSDSVNNELEKQVLDLRFSVEKTKISFSIDAEPPKSLILIAALFQNPESQDKHIKFLKKRFKMDTKGFGRKKSGLLLIKNIVVENRSFFGAIRIWIWRCVKWIAGLAAIKQLFVFLYNYF